MILDSLKREGNDVSVSIEPKQEDWSNLKTKLTEGEMTIVTRIKKLFESSNRTIELFIQPNINGLRPDIICIEKSNGAVKGGIWIIEVKDWDLTHFSIEKDNWIFDDKYEKKSPIKQVEQYRNEIIDISNTLKFKLLVNTKSPSNYLVKTAVYFHTDTRIAYNSFYTEMIFKGVTDEELSKFFVSTSRDSLELETYNSVKQYLGYLESDFETPEFSGDSKQTRILSEFNSGFKRKKIIGPAGSGKTELLAQMVASELMNGKEVLVLTFNITLRRFLHDRIRNALKKKVEKSHLTIDNYHRFVNKQCQQATGKRLGWSEQAYKDVNMFGNDNSESLPKFDAIFIDEYQDYCTEWATVVEKNFLVENGSFVVLGDANQNIYKRELEGKILPRVSIIGRPNELNVSHRSINAITKISKAYQQEFLAGMYDTPEIEIEQLNMFEVSEGTIFLTNETELDSFFKKVNTFLEKENIIPNRVSIIGFTKEKLRDYIDSYNKCCLEQDGMRPRTITNQSRTVCSNKEYNLLSCNESKVKQFERTLKSNFKPNYGTTKAITVNSLKGSETDVGIVILDDLINMSLDKNDNFEELLYTTITRARNYLIIYYNERENYPEKVKEFIEFLKKNENVRLIAG